MSTSQKNRCKRPSRRKQRRVTSDAAATLARSRARPDPEDHAQIVRGNRVTHVIVPVEEYERFVMAGMELELIAERERTGVDPFDDPNVEWIDIEDFAAQLAADRLVKARKAKGLTQKKLAEKLGVPQSQISRIERNPDRTTIRTLKRIAKALGVDVSALV